MEDLKENVLQATIDVFKEKGIKFTMDDIAKKLSISKKTIYTVTQNKNSLIKEMVKYSFERIKASEEAVIQDNSLSTTDKLEKLLSVLPEGYKDLDLASLYDLKAKYPDVGDIQCISTDKYSKDQVTVLLAKELIKRYK